MKNNISEADWKVRVDLAAMFRLTNMMGWDDTVWNHITARAPGTDHTFFMHEMGLLYDCLLYTSPSPRDRSVSRMPSSA